MGNEVFAAANRWSRDKLKTLRRVVAGDLHECLVFQKSLTDDKYHCVACDVIIDKDDIGDREVLT